MDAVIGFAIMLGVPVYFVLQSVLGLRYRGRWRGAALAPLIVAIPLLIYSFYAFAMGSNLWPLLFIFFAPFGCVYLLGLMGARVFFRP